MVQVLLKVGADVEAKDQDGSTSLHFASEYGHAAVVQTLLQHGADVAARTKVGAAGSVRRGRARDGDGPHMHALLQCACAGACPECRVPCAGERRRLPRPLLSLCPRR